MDELKHRSSVISKMRKGSISVLEKGRDVCICEYVTFGHRMAEC